MASANTQGGTIGTEIFVGSRKAVITAAETNQLKDRTGKVASIIVWDVGTTATLDLYDNASASSNKVWGWVSANGVGVFALQMPMQRGIRVVTGGTPGGWTVVYS